MALKVGFLLLIVCILVCHYQVTSIENVTNQVTYKTEDEHNKAPVPESVPSKEAPAPMKPLHHKQCHRDDDTGHHPDNKKCHHDPSTSLSKTMPMQAEALSKTPSMEGHGYTCDTVCKDHCKSEYSIDTCSKDCKKCCKKSFKCVRTPMNKDKKCKKTWDFTLVNGMKTKCPRTN